MCWGTTVGGGRILYTTEWGGMLKTVTLLDACLNLVMVPTRMMLCDVSNLVVVRFDLFFGGTW